MQITQELRNLARNNKIPIITATQGKQQSDNINQGMSATDVGDSYRKVRYTDYLFGVRMREDLNVFSDEVKKYVLRSPDVSDINENSPEIISIKNNLINDFIPMEIRINKSKETGKGSYRYILFCKRNVKLYNTIGDYLVEAQRLKDNTNRLNRMVKELVTTAGISVGTDGFENPNEMFSELEKRAINL